jgi:hypothetical protein
VNNDGIRLAIKFDEKITIKIVSSLNNNSEEQCKLLKFKFDMKITTEAFYSVNQQKKRRI